MAPQAAARQHGFAGRELPDADGAHVVGVLLNEVAVDRLVVLTVVTDQQPLDLGKLPRQPLQSCCACAPCPLRNQRSAVGPQSVSSSAPAG